MFKVNAEKCIGCGQCASDCFPKAIKLVQGKAVIENTACIKCGHCIAVCPVNAVGTDEYNMDDVIEYDSEAFDISHIVFIGGYGIHRAYCYTVAAFNTSYIFNHSLTLN
jgi:ferredoxin